MKGKVLVTGGDGQLGKSIRDIVNQKYPNSTFIYTDIQELDITDHADLDHFFSESSFDFIINTAAYTAVDKAEDEPEAAFLLNATAIKYLTEICKKHNIFLIHISTDYVFDGLSKIPYTPDALTHPLSVYGKSKLAGEKFIEESGCSAAIFRTSWLYSLYGKNFVKSILHHARQNDKINVVNDQYGAPTYAPDLADAILTFMTKKNLHHSFNIYHYANKGHISWYDFAVEILRIKAPNCHVIPISTAEYPTRASRPAFSVFDLSKTKQQIGISIPYWADSLETALANLI